MRVSWPCGPLAALRSQHSPRWCSPIQRPLHPLLSPALVLAYLGGPRAGAEEQLVPEVRLRGAPASLPTMQSCPTGLILADEAAQPLPIHPFAQQRRAVAAALCWP